MDPDDNHYHDYLEQDYQDNLVEEMKENDELYSHFRDHFLLDHEDLTISFFGLFNEGVEDILELFLESLNDALPSDKTLNLESDEPYRIQQKEELTSSILIGEDISIQNKKGICFKLDFSSSFFSDINSDFEVIKAISQEFILNINESTQYVWKFWDYAEFAIRKNEFQKIAKLECDLREALSFIFLAEDSNLEDVPKIKLRTGKDNKWESKIWKKNENKFSYIDFSDYKKLLYEKDFSFDELWSMVKRSKKLEALKEQVLNRKNDPLKNINSEKNKDFILSIKSELVQIENFRNSIMHSRAIDSRDRNNFELNYKKLSDKIIKFRKKEKKRT